MPGARVLLRPVFVGAALALVAASCAGATTRRGKASTPRAQVPVTTPGSPGPSPPTPIPTGNWTTYHGDLARSGVAPADPALASVAPAWTSPQLDGHVYAEPLVWGNLVIVATTNDTLYGLKASDGTVAWRAHLGTPVPVSDLTCGDVDPLGILSTPVIEPSSGRLFAVAETLRNGQVSHQLFALDAGNGVTLFSETADPAGMNARDQQQRSALAVNGGRVYIAFGGLYGDCGRYHGWVAAASTSAPGALLSYRVPTANEGAIWAPPGPTIDGAGNLYVATGNGSSTTTFDHGNAVIKLSPTLVEEDYFAAGNWAEDSANDADLGSTSPALVPDGQLFEVGKEQTGYLINQSGMGHVGGQAASATVCFTIGGDAVSGSDVYVPCSSGVKDVHIDSTRSFHVEWSAPSAANGSPVVAGGLVWTIGSSSGQLYGLNPATGAVVAQTALGGNPDKFVTPGVGDGLLIVPTGTTVRAFAGTAHHR